MGKPDLSGGGSGGSPDSHRNLGGRPIRSGGLCCRMGNQNSCVTKWNLGQNLCSALWLTVSIDHLASLTLR